LPLAIVYCGPRRGDLKTNVYRLVGPTANLSHHELAPTNHLSRTHLKKALSNAAGGIVILCAGRLADDFEDALDLAADLQTQRRRATIVLGIEAASTWPFAARTEHIAHLLFICTESVEKLVATVSAMTAAFTLAAPSRNVAGGFDRIRNHPGPLAYLVSAHIEPLPNWQLEARRLLARALWNHALAAASDNRPIQFESEATAVMGAIANTEPTPDSSRWTLRRREYRDRLLSIIFTAVAKRTQTISELMEQLRSIELGSRTTRPAFADLLSAVRSELRLVQQSLSRPIVQADLPFDAAQFVRRIMLLDPCAALMTIRAELRPASLLHLNEPFEDLVNLIARTLIGAARENLISQRANLRGWIPTAHPDSNPATTTAFLFAQEAISIDWSDEQWPIDSRAAVIAFNPLRPFVGTAL
jgi:hypothetical protein